MTWVSSLSHSSFALGLICLPSFVGQAGSSWVKVDLKLKSQQMLSMLLYPDSLWVYGENMAQRTAANSNYMCRETSNGMWKGKEWVTDMVILPLQMFNLFCTIVSLYVLLTCNQCKYIYKNTVSYVSCNISNNILGAIQVISVFL